MQEFATVSETAHSMTLTNNPKDSWKKFDSFK